MDFLVFFPFIVNIGLRLGIFREFLIFFNFARLLSTFTESRSYPPPPHDMPDCGSYYATWAVAGVYTPACAEVLFHLKREVPIVSFHCLTASKHQLAVQV